MKLEGSRRKFLKTGLGALAVATVAPVLSSTSAHALFNPLASKNALHPLLPVKGPATDMKYGYTSMTWGSNDKLAIEDISSLGFTGIQLRANAVTDFKPSELRDILQKHSLTFVALSSGDLNIDPAVEKEEIAKHVTNAKFMQDTGGLYLQILDQLKPRPRTVTPDDCKRLGKLLTEIGKRTTDLGVQVGYHNHLNTISELPENLERVLDASDPKYVKFLLDTAHYCAGGGDSAKAIEKHQDRLLFVHLKDVVDEPMGTEKNQKYPFKWVELGRGKCDLLAVFAALHKVQFHGWAVVELDRVPDKSRTPRECAVISKKYMEEKLGCKL
jgi:inosose dehydratase